MYGRKAELLCNQVVIMNEVASEFLSVKPRKRVWGNFRIEGDRLIHESTEMREISGTGDDEKKGALIKETLESVIAGNTAWHSKNNKTATQVLEAVKTDPRRYQRFYIQDTDVDVIAIKIKREGQPDLIVGNSSVLSGIGKTVLYGNVSRNSRVTVIQTVLQSKIPMVPFVVFQSAGLDLNKMVLLEQGGAEVIKVKELRKDRNYKEFTVTVDRHFTGASLFEVQGRHFLFDIDRREIKHHIFNVFLVELASKAKTIAEAYEGLKPKAVKDAENKGLEVLRQGEWFFIPTKEKPEPKLSDREKLLACIDPDGFRFERSGVQETLGKSELKMLLAQATKVRESIPRQLSLRAGQNRPNTVKIGLQKSGITYVTDKVEHSGREHAALILKGWYIAVPNTSTKSFTITGDVD